MQEGCGLWGPPWHHITLGTCCEVLCCLAQGWPYTMCDKWGMSWTKWKMSRGNWGMFWDNRGMWWEKRETLFGQISDLLGPIYQQASRGSGKAGKA